MTSISRRAALILASSAMLSAQALPAAPAQTPAPAAAPAKAAAAAERPWLYENSDVPIDPAWRFGILDNGLRYAIRRNSVPPGQVSVRVRIDAGSLMERADERGFAHFIEHLSFRGSREVPDGEAKRTWQRLGATFGSDSNAQTTPTGTTYALDLPQADSAGLAQSMKILAGMMEAPNIVPEAVTAERSVILAEMRERLGPATRVGDAARALYFAGQPLADANPIGTVETLNGATAEALRAFHDRWYRPDRTVISVSGDIDPVLMENYVRTHFAAWRGRGESPPQPDFGKPDPARPETAVVVEPGAPISVGLAFLRPWEPKADTIVYNQGKLTDDLALQLINRRLEQAARGEARFLQATVEQQDVSRSASGTFVSITPMDADWRGALSEVRAIIADAMQSPPSEADIVREYAQMETAFVIAAENADTEASATQAETLMGAVDIRETTVTAQAALDIFRGARAGMTPERILDSTRRMFASTAQRSLLTLKAPEQGAEAALAAALDAPVEPAKDVRLAEGAVTMDSLPALPPPGSVVSRRPLGALRVEEVKFANGVTLYLFPNRAETEKVRINVRFGDGRRSFGPGQDPAAWAAPYVLSANGIGSLGQRELDELTNGRRISFNFGIDDDAFELSAVSRPADYRDQLRLYATKLAFPAWNARPLERIKAVMRAAQDSSDSSAEAVLNRDLGWLLRNRDARYAPATAQRIEALTPQAFRSTWEPLLKRGPIEVQIFGDVNADEAIAAVGATFGALAPRPATALPAANLRLAFPKPVTAPVVLRHSGAADQAAAVFAWPTGGGHPQIRDSRQLEALSQIINDRLFERLRSVDGATYSPSVSSYWPLSYSAGGYIVVSSQAQPERLALVGRMVDEIVRDLAARPVSDDELQRIVTPMRQLLGRASTGNAFWMSQIEGASRDANVIPAMMSFADQLLGVTAADIQRLAQTYLVDRTRWSAIVLPTKATVPQDLARGWPRGAPAAMAGR